MKKKLVIFDFDGTMVDTIIDAAVCFNKTLDFFGFKTYPIEQYANLFGGNLEVIFSRLLDEKDRIPENISKLKEKYREIYSDYSKPNTKPFDGIIDVLKTLNDNNILVAINTNKAQKLTEELCKTKFNGFKFSGIFGYCDERPSKPDPYGVNELMKINNVQPVDTVYVGDGLTDIKTAENAGIDCILVSWGQGNIEALSKENAVSFIANTPSDILRFI